MTYLAIAELVLIGVLIYLRDREREKNAEVIVEITRLGMDERRELANRIQRPDILPQQPAPRRQSQPPPHPNLAKIGTVAVRDD